MALFTAIHQGHKRTSIKEEFSGHGAAVW